MKIHIQWVNYKLWRITENGNLVFRDPKTNLPKNKEDYNYEDEKLMNLNVEVMNM